jgi:hypothetical protein
MREDDEERRKTSASDYDVGAASAEGLHVLTNSPNMTSSMTAGIPRN